MDAIQELAFARISKKNSKRETVKPGHYPVDFVARIQGEVRVGKDGDYIPTAELPPLGLLTVAMRYCGITREALADAITKAANKATEEGKTFRELVENDNEWAREMINAVREQITYKLDKKTRKGSVTGTVTCELIELDNLTEL